MRFLARDPYKPSLSWMVPEICQKKTPVAIEMMETSDFFFGFGTRKQKGWYNLRRGQTTATFTRVSGSTKGNHHHTKVGPKTPVTSRGLITLHLKGVYQNLVLHCNQHVFSTRFCGVRCHRQKKTHLNSTCFEIMVGFFCVIHLNNCIWGCKL